MEYDFCTLTQETANQNKVYNISSALIGWFWSKSTQLILESFMTVSLKYEDFKRYNKKKKLLLED